MIEHENFHASLHSASSKTLTETFQRIDICIFCSLQSNFKLILMDNQTKLIRTM